MAIFAGAAEKAITTALSEVIVMAELRPALDLLAELTTSTIADYFRFPRYATGALGSAVLEMSPTSAVVPGKPYLAAQPLGTAAHALLVTLDDLPFAQRGCAGIVMGRAEPYARKERVVIEKSLAAWSAAARRIRKFEALAGENTGLTTLIEKRLGACAILATPHGNIIWMSQSARDALGTHGRAMLEARLRIGTKELVHAPKASGHEFALSLDGKHRLYGAMSFVREGPDTSIHYVAVELFGSDVESPADEAKLTPSEREVYKLLKLGQSNAEIARARFVSVETVRSHVKTMFRKLGITSRVALLVRKKS